MQDSRISDHISDQPQIEARRAPNIKDKLVTLQGKKVETSGEGH